ncbi:hypothetical protein K490DRAFT_64087 [Saccharata proteae CBS 121410]|uniref:C2H2-type domain-containing protein n=1 Tax=Saccharata proteae CBS 121410 TaxID=1314787 RepID=A0A6A5YAI7_9PEZI|nr:hypothetical protein K490DRAFT_64087 [Saccharata proteae CBS 121410]
MASDGYHSSYYGSGQNQRSQHPSYSAYQTAQSPSINPATQNPQSHLSQSQASVDSYPAYAAQPSYTQAAGYASTPQEYSYNASNYGGTATSASQARSAEASDLQNLAYASGLRSSGSRVTANPPPSVSTAPSYNAPASPYGQYAPQQPARPKSVNSLAGNPQQRRSPVVDNQTSRTGLPPPTGYSSPTPRAPAPTTQQRTVKSPQVPSTYQAPSSTPRTDYTQRTLPAVTQPTPATSQNTPYHWNQQSTAQTSQAPSYEQTSTTVDPTQVYDPWQEYQRKAEAAKAARAIEERAQAERAKMAAEEAERKAEAERIRVAEENSQAEQRKEEERCQLEQQAIDEQRKASEAQRLQESGKKKKTANTKTKISKAAAAAGPASETDLEAQMRALMAQMREFNNKDPALLARIWDEERKAKEKPNTSPATQQSVPVGPTPTVATPAANGFQAAQPTSLTGSGTPRTATPVASTARNGTANATPQPSTGPSMAQRQMNPSARPSMPLGSSGKTHWPPEKKEQISKAAASWLNANPLNQNNPISPQQVHAILDSNPRYIELCEMLEAHGVKLERAAFARALLAAVPDINSSSPAQSRAPHTLSGSSNAIQRPHSLPQNPPHSGMQTHAHSPAAQAQPAPQPHGEAPRDRGWQYPEPKAHAYQSPYSQPATSGPNSDAMDQVPPPSLPPVAPIAQMQGRDPQPKSRESSQKPATKADAARKTTFSALVDLTALSDDDEPPPKRQAFEHQVAPVYAPAPHMQKQHDGYSMPVMLSNGPQLGPPMPPIDEKTRNMDVAQPIRRRDALRRSTYSVKTIARDVLLATGRHPEMRPLNGHLEGLKSTFRTIDNSTDLSSLRWDLIDPGDPPRDAAEPTVLESESEDADDEEEADQRPKSPVTQQKPVPWPSKKGPDRPPRHSMPSTTFIPHRPSPHGHQNTDPATSTPSNTSINKTMAAPRSEGSKAPIGNGVLGYSAFQQYNEDGTPIKKKGRPVGWRKSLHSKEAQARAAGILPTLPAKNKSAANRQGAAPITTHVNKAAFPNYNVYLCQWKSCSAELHNMATLRKHVEKKHKGLICLWGGCGTDLTTFEGPAETAVHSHKHSEFPTVEAWQKHVEQKHLVPLQWQLGDGHAAGLSESHESASESYLSDSRGRHLTPKISAPAADARSTLLGSKQRPGKDVQKALDAQAAMVLKVRQLGPGLDRGGARLANDKRRMGFIDDNDHEEEVSDD